jgi:hypothetical protein
LVCSTINKILDLSLNRCKTGWILSLKIHLLLVRKEFNRHYRGTVPGGRGGRSRGDDRAERNTRGSSRRAARDNFESDDTNGSPRARHVEVVRHGSGNDESSDSGGRANTRGGRRGGGGKSSASIPAVDLSFAAAGVPAEVLRAHTTLELGVPDHLVGAIVGVQGAKLAAIEDMSGAKISISKRGEFVKDTNNRIVTIVGTPVCAQTAHTLIIHKLRQEQEEKR